MKNLILIVLVMFTLGIHTATAQRRGVKHSTVTGNGFLLADFQEDDLTYDEIVANANAAGYALFANQHPEYYFQQLPNFGFEKIRDTLGAHIAKHVDGGLDDADIANLFKTGGVHYRKVYADYWKTSRCSYVKKLDNKLSRWNPTKSSVHPNRPFWVIGSVPTVNGEEDKFIANCFNVIFLGGDEDFPVTNETKAGSTIVQQNVFLNLQQPAPAPISPAVTNPLEKKCLIKTFNVIPTTIIVKRVMKHKDDGTLHFKWNSDCVNCGLSLSGKDDDLIASGLLAKDHYDYTLTSTDLVSSDPSKKVWTVSYNLTACKGISKSVLVTFNGRTWVGRNLLPIIGTGLGVGGVLLWHPWKKDNKYGTDIQDTSGQSGAKGGTGGQVTTVIDPSKVIRNLPGLAIITTNYNGHTQRTIAAHVTFYFGTGGHH